MSQAQASSESSTTIRNDFQQVTINGGNNFFGSHVHGHVGAQSAAKDSLLSTLRYPDQGVRYEDVADAYSNTYEWLFKPPVLGESWSSFIEWLQGDQREAYWVSGRAGSGKSTLMKFVIQHPSLMQHLDCWVAGRQLVVIWHFFWKAGSLAQRSLLGLLRSLVYQVLGNSGQPELPKTLEGLGPSPQWTTKLLLRILFGMISTHNTQAFCFFIDGLDEFEGDTSDYDQLVDLIRRVSELPNAKVCLSSRPSVYLEEILASANKLSLHQLTHADMYATAQGRLLQYVHFRKQLRSDPKGADRLIRQVCYKADGVFLWLYLVLEDLIRGLRKYDTLPMLELRVSSLRGSLYGLFVGLLQDLDAFHQKRTANIVRLLQYQEGQDFTVLSVLDVAAVLDPAHINQDIEAPLKKKNFTVSNATRTFEDLNQYATLVSEWTAGLVECVFQGHRSRCYATSIQGCSCAPEIPGPSNVDVLTPWATLFRHFRSLNIRYIHRSAYDFFKDDKTAKEFLASNADEWVGTSKFWASAARYRIPFYSNLLGICAADLAKRFQRSNSPEVDAFDIRRSAHWKYSVYLVGDILDAMTILARRLFENRTSSSEHYQITKLLSDAHSELQVAISGSRCHFLAAQSALGLEGWGLQYLRESRILHELSRVGRMVAERIIVDLLHWIDLSSGECWPYCSLTLSRSAWLVHGMPKLRLAHLMKAMIYGSRLKDYLVRSDMVTHYKSINGRHLVSRREWVDIIHILRAKTSLPDDERAKLDESLVYFLIHDIEMADHLAVSWYAQDANIAAGTSFNVEMRLPILRFIDEVAIKCLPMQQSGIDHEMRAEAGSPASVLSIQSPSKEQQYGLEAADQCTLDELGLVKLCLDSRYRLEPNPGHALQIEFARDTPIPWTGLPAKIAQEAGL